MAQSKFNMWVKMLANPLKPDIFDSHPLEMLIFWATSFFIRIFLSYLSKKKYTRKTYPKKTTLIWFVRENKKWKPISRSYKRSIRTALIIIIDPQLGKQLRTISQKKKKKLKNRDLSLFDLGLL